MMPVLIFLSALGVISASWISVYVGYRFVIWLHDDNTRRIKERETVQALEKQRLAVRQLYLERHPRARGLARRAFREGPSDK